jgi:thiamine-phosphate pyrophosphorylase
MSGVGFTFPSRLYPIADTVGDTARSHVDIAAAMVHGGTRFLQLRVKDRSSADFVAIARAVKRITDAVNATLIVNDRADIAKLIDADGVHLGQDDLPPRAARDLLGEGKIIGLSTHTLEQADTAAVAEPVNYIAFGPIFSTTSKNQPDPVQGLDVLRAVRQRVTLPIVAIGGITAASMPAVLAAGADAVAMIGEIVNAPSVEAKLRELLRVDQG